MLTHWLDIPAEDARSSAVPSATLRRGDGTTSSSWFVDISSSQTQGESLESFTEITPFNTMVYGAITCRVLFNRGRIANRHRNTHCLKIWSLSLSSIGAALVKTVVLTVTRSQKFSLYLSTLLNVFPFVLGQPRCYYNLWSSNLSQTFTQTHAKHQDSICHTDMRSLSPRSRGQRPHGPVQGPWETERRSWGHRAGGVKLDINTS